MTENLAEWLLEQLEARRREVEALRQSTRDDHPWMFEDENDEPAEDAQEFDPVLVDLDAKRRIVEKYVRQSDPAARDALEDVLELLALPFVDRPGYRDEWRPDA